jgi:hypothetical protein
MKIYIDEDTASRQLTQLLRAAGHDVQIPVEAGLVGKSDVVQLTHAVREGRVCLSRNYEDFEELHDLLKESGGRHPGILVVRRDNDPRRNMAPRDVVKAVRNLEGAGIPLMGEYQVLNHWR